MSDKQTVLKLVRAMPNDATLSEIIEEVDILVAIRRGEADVAAGRVKTQAEVERLMESWIAQWSSKQTTVVK